MYVFNPIMQFGIWRERRSSSSPQTMGEFSFECSGKKIACLIQRCVIEKSPGFGDVDTGNHNQLFPEALWLHGIIYHLIVHYSAMWENLQSEWPVKLNIHTHCDLVFA